MKLNLKEWIAKITDSEPKKTQLASTATLIRIGVVRILSLNEYSLDTGVVLAVEDRPTTAIQNVMWAHANNGQYYKGGNVLINTDGTITAWMTTNYNTTSGQSPLGNTEKIMSVVVWSV